MSETPEQNSDEAVLALAVQGDQESFGLLYERYVGRIYNYVYYRTGNHHDAEDLTARVFFRAIRSIRTFQDRGLPISAWLYRIAHNLVANWHRDKSRRPEILLDDGLSFHHPQSIPKQPCCRLRRERLMRIIRKLPKTSAIGNLKFVDHLPPSDNQIMGRTGGVSKACITAFLFKRRLVELVPGDKLASTPEIGEIDAS
jgi:RNA polymerase sigma-70 factor (ECF subfamily)